MPLKRLAPKPINNPLLPRCPQPTSSRLPRAPKKKKFNLLKFKSWFRTAKNLPKHLAIWQKRKEWYQIDNVLEAIQIYEEGL